MEKVHNIQDRKIIHLDMDAFYASVEQRDNPHLRGKPIAVGGSPTGRGVVSTCSYEARKFGVHSAMPSATAMRLCPGIIFVRGRMDAYKAASQKIRGVFREFTDLVEPLSLDEAYLDVTQSKTGHTSAIYMARLIRERIFEETQLTGTAGVSYNKFLAKTASDLKKPNGLNYISKEQAIPFLEALKIGKFYGIGKKTAEKMKLMGIHTGADLKKYSRTELVRKFGKSGGWYYDIVRGIDLRKVKPNRPMKSASVEDTFPEDTSDMVFLDSQIDILSARLFRRLDSREVFGKTVSVKVKYANFEQVTRSKTLEYPVGAAHECAEIAKELLPKTQAGTRLVRLLGVGTSNFGLEEEYGPGGQLRIPFTDF